MRLRSLLIKGLYWLDRYISEEYYRRREKRGSDERHNR